jgi:hypothetical protein
MASTSKADSLIALANKLTAASGSTALNEAGKPRKLTKRQQALIQEMLHGEHPETGKGQTIKSAAVSAGYADTSSGYMIARREWALPHVQAEVLRQLALEISRSMITVHRTLDDVMENSRSDKARVEAAVAMTTVHKNLVMERGAAGGGQGNTLIIHLDHQGNEPRDVTPPSGSEPFVPQARADAR